MNKYLLGVVLLVIVAGAGWWYLAQPNEGAPTDLTSTNNCTEATELAFSSGASLTDSHTKVRFVVPPPTVTITNAEYCPSSRTLRTTISLGERSIYISAAANPERFSEWNAGVPITKLETTTVRIAGTDTEANVFDVQENVDGTLEPLGQPFMMVFIDYDGTHYMLQLPYDSEELKQTSLSFLSSLTFVK